MKGEQSEKRISHCRLGPSKLSIKLAEAQNVRMS